MRISVSILLFSFLSAFAAPGFGQRGSSSVERDRLLLYQTFNFPINGKLGAFGYPDAAAGDAEVTSGWRGKFGEAIEFPTPDSAIGYQAEGNFPLTKDYNDGTIAMWVRCASGEQPEDRFAELFEVNDGSWNDGAFGLALTPGQPGRIVFSLYGSAPVSATGETVGGPQHLIAYEGIDWATGEWHHIAASWENINTGRRNAVLKLYVDAERQRVSPRFDHVVHWRSPQQTIRVGWGFVGWIDELAIFGKALSERQIRRIFEHPEGVSGVYL